MRSVEGVNLGDFVQLGAAAPFCWLFWQYDKAIRAEREAQRQTNERLASSILVLAMRLTGRPLDVEITPNPGAPHVQS